jgi:hypothetical protein
MKRRHFLSLPAASVLVRAQAAGQISLVAPLPDLLTLKNGNKVRTAEEWTKLRRPEILRLLEDNQFGRTPSRRLPIRYVVASSDPSAIGGLATRKIVEIQFAGKPDGPKASMLIYLPNKAKGPVPVFLGLSFNGNHAVHSDPGIPLAQMWIRANRTAPYVRQTADESTRGSEASRWEAGRILDRGCALATIYNGDIEGDFNGSMPSGVRQLFLAPGQTEFGPGEWGAIGTWAWALSRAADYLATDKAIDARRMAVMGHSRFGKTALWAGAQDQRFSIVISNDSGEGGAALSRRRSGELVAQLNNNFPHWFCRNYRQYNDREADLPVDSHFLLAMVAPRGLYVASAIEDLHADPQGEFLAAAEASAAWELLGKKGLGTREMPKVDAPIQNDVAYHVRQGKHDVTAYDWDRYLDFAEKHWGR